jgi:Na+/H+ antiporter NhaC
MTTVDQDERNAMPEDDDVVERIHALEVAQATQVASSAGAQATMAATQAGATAATGASVAGLAAAVASGAGGLIVGIFLGLAISKAE